MNYLFYFLCGKFDLLLLSYMNRWALYPPGRVPLGVTVHVNDEDGDVDIETPSSLQVTFCTNVNINSVKVLVMFL